MLHANPNKKRESDIKKIERRAQFIKEVLEEVEELKLTFEYKKTCFHMLLDILRLESVWHYRIERN